MLCQFIVHLALYMQTKFPLAGLLALIICFMFTETTQHGSARKNLETVLLGCKYARKGSQSKIQTICRQNRISEHVLTDITNDDFATM